MSLALTAFGNLVAKITWPAWATVVCLYFLAATILIRRWRDKRDEKRAGGE